MFVVRNEVLRWVGGATGAGGANPKGRASPSPFEAGWGRRRPQAPDDPRAPLRQVGDIAL